MHRYMVIEVITECTSSHREVECLYSDLCLREAVNVIMDLEHDTPENMDNIFVVPMYNASVFKEFWRNKL